MTFPGLFTGHNPTRGSGQGGCKFSRVGSGGSKHIKTLRVGSGRVKRFQNLAGRVVAGQLASKFRGSGRVGSRGFHNLAGRVEIRVTRGSSWLDPRVAFG